MVKRKSILLFIFLCVFSGIVAHEISDKINFSGIWVLNVEKSEFGQAPIRTALKKINIQQSMDSIKVEAFNTKESGEDITSVISYSTTGELSKRILSNNRKMIAAVKWSEESQMLIKKASYSFVNNQQEEEYNSVETWKLSVDGKTLTIMRTTIFKTGFGFSINAVYDKM